MILFYYCFSMEPDKDYCQKNKLPLLDVPVSFLDISNLKYYKTELLPCIKFYTPKKIDKWPNRILLCREIYFELGSGWRYEDAIGCSDLFDDEPAIEDLEGISKFVIKIPKITNLEKEIKLETSIPNSPFFKDKEGKIYSLLKKDIPRPNDMFPMRRQSPKNKAIVCLITSVYIYGVYQRKEQSE